MTVTGFVSEWTSVFERIIWANGWLITHSVSSHHLQVMYDLTFKKESLIFIANRNMQTRTNWAINKQWNIINQIQGPEWTAVKDSFD